MPAGEPVEPGYVAGAWLVFRDGVGKTPARTRNRLEPAIAPAGVEVETVDRGLVDDRATIHGHVHDPTPMTQQTQPRHGRNHRDAFRYDVLDQRQVPALGIGIVAVEIAAEDEAALIGLAHIEMPSTEGEDLIHRLEPFGDKGLQDMTFDRKIKAELAGQFGRLPATESPTFPAMIVPRVVSTPVTRPPSRMKPVTSQFWMRSTPR